MRFRHPVKSTNSRYSPVTLDFVQDAAVTNSSRNLSGRCKSLCVKARIDIEAANIRQGVTCEPDSACPTRKVFTFMYPQRCS